MRRVGLLAVLAFVAGCASAGAPPGGPEDHAPPEIIAISPDSGQTNVGIREVEFKIDEVVSDRPAGPANLDQLFLVSPRDGSPSVSWHRSRITVKPRKGFRANTAYRVTMLPGLADLRGNARKEGATILFSTGPAFPPFSILGRVFDWETQKTLNGAYIEAMSRADTTLVFVTATDTAGRFDVGPLPAGDYTVRALLDANSNRVIDRAEKWDTTTAHVTESRPTVELDVIDRDSTPAFFSNVTVDDSVTIHVTFDKPIDPRLSLQTSLVRLQRADSSELMVTGIQWAAAFATQKQTRDSIRRADSTRAATPPAAAAGATGAARPPAAVPAPPAGTPPTATPGGARGAPPPMPKSPPPERAVVLTLSPTTPVLPATTYRITARGFRNLVGNGREATRTFTVPKPAAPRDSTKTRPDSARRPPPKRG